MPANNKKANKGEQTFTVGETPKAKPPASIIVKNLQDALIDGEKSPSQFMRDFLDVEPYEKQALVLDAVSDAREANFSAGNRVGKTFASGGLLLWKAFFRHHPSQNGITQRTQYNTYKAVNTSLTFEQAKLAWTYAYNFASTSKRFKPFLVDTVHSPFPLMTLRTRDEKGEWVPTEIHARSLAKNGLYLLGMSINHLQIDECAYVPKYPTIEDEVLRMRLADTGGSIFRFSTPNGRNFFYTYYLEGKKGDLRIVSRTLTSWDNPFVDRAYLKEQKARMLPEYYAQNVMGEFVSLSDFFPMSVIEGLYTRNTKEGVEPIEYALPQGKVTGGIYVMGADLGSTKDPTEVIVWRVDVNPIQTVYVGTTQGKGWEAGKQKVRDVYGLYTPVVTAVDATGGGGHIAEQLVQELTGVIPFVFSFVSKPLALTSLQQAAQGRRFVFPLNRDTEPMVQQMSFYRTDDKDLVQDKVMALALVNHAYDEWAKQHQMTTTLYDDLAFIDVIQGGAGIGGTDDGFGPGTMFEFDPHSGLFMPTGSGGFNDGFDF